MSMLVGELRINSIRNQVWDSSKSNNWARPASLNTYLNGTYYNGLNSIAQSQIVAKDWSIGAVKYDDINMANTINNENSKKWNGKVALITVSEYVRSNSNKSNCGTVNRVYNAKDGQCQGTTWMYYYSDELWWTLSPTAGRSETVFDVDYFSGYGCLDYTDAKNGNAFLPVVYLSSEVKITGGNGSQNNPYTLG